ncbi:MAG: radical SAM protein [Clostridia bacterium]|nr:radical SAM protein [Clostridia bacterium]
MSVKAPFIAIARHRIQTDGEGVTTLCGFYGCPLRCKYCLNPQSFSEDTKKLELTPQELFERVKIDDLYFTATNGGVTFGGGEPLLYPDFLVGFRLLCGDKWRLCVETSLNVSSDAVRTAAEFIDEFLIDIKDMNPEIYRHYTGKSNELVIKNLKLLLSLVPKERMLIRLPLIEGFNTDYDRNRSRKFLQEMGFERFDLFEYKVKR